jgi:hypothetical protein
VSEIVWDRYEGFFGVKLVRDDGDLMAQIVSENLSFVIDVDGLKQLSNLLKEANEAALYLE